MKIALGIIGVLLVLALIYYFLPQGIKTTVGAIFGGRNSRVTRTASPSPRATTVVTSTPFPTPITTATPFPSATVRASASPSSTARATASATPRIATQSASAPLPGTGIQDQPPELIAIEILASAFLLLVGYRLSKHS
jgi:hypothetical protein